MGNFIVCIVAIMLAMYSVCKNDITCCLLSATAALINLPFAIKWLLTYFN